MNNMIKREKINILLRKILLQNFLILVILFITNCGNFYQPKPKGYFRIDLPQKTYLQFDNNYPFSFEYPTYSKVISDSEEDAEPYWINLYFPKYKGTLHISYKEIVKSQKSKIKNQKKESLQNTLNKYIEDSRMFAMKHIPKTNGIDERVINNSTDKVYGLIYNISGTGAASTYQFYLTDSTTNFLRGALYFYFKPNNDSIAPVIDFIKQDIDHMIKTFRWKHS